MEHATTRFSGNGGLPRTPEQIQREIEETREDLAGTVAAVVERMNVKRRAQRKASRGAETARDHAVPIAAGAAAVAVAVAWLLVRKRNESQWDQMRSRGRKLVAKGSDLMPSSDRMPSALSR